MLNDERKKEPSFVQHSSFLSCLIPYVREVVGAPL
jgi:hypothetical protein